MSGTTRPNSFGTADLAAFLIATGLITLHVIDDNFLQPEPGMSAADHPVSGLVPLACLLIAAAAYPRLRPGLRAILCTVVGLFGITTGVEGWYYAIQVGPSRDDYTGIIASLAGLALLVIAGITLWRSRRLDDPLWRRYLRRGLTTVITLMVLLEVAYPLAVAYGGTHLARPAPPVAELGLPHEEVDIQTSDGVTIKGWYVPSQNRAAVITYPGRHSAQRHAQFLARHGYGVLLLDRRGQGGSEGDPNSYGWDEHHDVAAAIAFLRDRSEIDPDRIGGIGFSVGGEVLLETAAWTPELRAVVSEGAGFRSIREFRHIAPSRWFIVPLVSFATLGTAVFSNGLPPPDLTDIVGRITPRPILLIYAENGVGGEELNQVFHEAAGITADLWRVPGSSHLGGIDAQPEEYERRVTDFFDRALLAGPR
ncbi:MAG TPA: alpha/beta fold hydrolase [Propionibacteriaceae bacterium]|nr:alpha/beta fold hydrolase [Propionibacteriaceae bacterium]